MTAGGYKCDQLMDGIYFFLYERRPLPVTHSNFKYVRNFITFYWFSIASAIQSHPPKPRKLFTTRNLQTRRDRRSTKKRLLFLAIHPISLPLRLPSTVKSNNLGGFGHPPWLLLFKCRSHSFLFLTFWETLSSSSLGSSAFAFWCPPSRSTEFIKDTGSGSIGN